MDFEQRQARGVGGRPHHTFERPGSDIKKSGYLKKLKTNKKKFFVLRSTSSSGPARLEYHDSEKKFKASNPPKRSIELHTCFNINRHAESRHCRNGLVLYTSEDSFVVLADSPEEQEAWLSLMLEYQYEYMPNGDEHREHYEHVWSVVLQPKGLGNKNSKGQYRVCLNNTSVSLIKTPNNKPLHVIQLPTIRNIAQSECSFCMEVGKYAPTGEGKFWFQADNADVVKDMHSTLHQYMNSTKEPGLKKDTSIRARSGSYSMSPNHRRHSKVEQRPASFYTSGTTSWRSSIDTTSPGSVSSSFGPTDHILGSHRPRSDTGDSRISRGSSQHEDGPHDFFITSYKNGDMHDSMKTKELNVVPPDMSPPPSPKMFEEQLSAYLEMDTSLHSNHSAGSNSMGHHHNASVSSPGSSYMAMSPHSQSSSVKGDLSPSLPDSSPSAGSSYMSMAQGGLPVGGGGGGSHFGSHVSAPIPIHPHVTSHPPHPTPLPTVREGGSNEGYLPMDVSSSPSTPSNLRPEPVKCMLSLDDSSSSNMGLPPRTYSLGRKPVGKKYPGYMDMVTAGGQGGAGGGPRKGSLNNDSMLRATSAPHIIHKSRRERDHDHVGGGGFDSPIPSPLSMSIKSDDSDSFMEYMPMRPRTASDSYNYRPRTSSQGKLQPMCRPRSSSHGQGTRPVTKFRITPDGTLHRGPSRDSSLHDSFDSLRVSNESLRRVSQDLRHSPVVSVTDQGEMRGSPPPPRPLSGKSNNHNTSNSSNNSGKEIIDSYMAMDLASNLHHHKPVSSSSPHRIRTDSNSSGSHRPDFLTSSQDSEYTEMAPVGHSSRSGSYSSGSKVVVVGGDGGEDYMNMRRPTPSPVLSTSLQSSSAFSDAAYVNMDLDFAGAGGGGSGARRTESGRSASVENVDSYIMYDPAPNSGNKLRTGSVGSKDKKMSLRVSAAASKRSNNPHFQPQQPPTVSASTKKGGSSDSIRKPARQSSMEKYGSLGKDFRKKSGSTGSRPMSASKLAGGGGGGAGVGDAHHGHMGFNLIPIRKSTTPLSVSGWSGGDGGGGDGEDPDDEYIEFSPNAYRDASGNHDSGGPGSSTSTTTTPSIPSITTSATTPGFHIQSTPSPVTASSFSWSLSSPAPPATANVPLSHINHPHQQQQQSSLNDDDDYTPYAPASNTITNTTPTLTVNTTSAHHQHQSATRSSRQNDSDYTPFAPAVGGGGGGGGIGGIAPISHPQYHNSNPTSFPKSSSSSSPKQPASSSSSRKHLQQSADGESDYVGYDPSPRQPQSSAFTTSQPAPSSAAYHFQSSASADVLSRHKTPKVQHHSSLDSASRQDPNASSVSGGIHTSTSLTFDPAHSSSTSPGNLPRDGTAMLQPSSCSSSSSSPRAVLNPAQLTFSYAAPQPKKPENNNKDDSEYLEFNPAKPKTTTNVSNASSSHKNSASGVDVGGSLMKATSLIKTDDSNLMEMTTPLTVDITTSLSSQSPSTASPSPSPSLSLSKTQSNSIPKNIPHSALTSPSNQPKSEKQGGQKQHHVSSSPLSCITTTHLSNCNTVTTNTTNNNNNNKNNSQMSPSCHSSSPSPSPSPSPQLSSQLPTVSENNPPWNMTAAATTNPSPSSSTTRQKHASGSSTSSQKSRRISGDSSSDNSGSNNNNNKSLRKTSKSDSNSSISSSGSKNSNNNSGGRRRVPSGEKTPQSGSAEKSPLISPSSRSKEEFFCGSPSMCSGKSLEAKMVTVESKIRHSVGDVTPSSSGNSSGGEGSGLIRPGSTPCFHNMDTESSSSSSSSGGENRLVGGRSGSGSNVSNTTGNESIGSGTGGSGSQRSSGQSSGSRSRHSLSDLGAYQQMSGHLNECSSSGGGSGDSCGSGSLLSNPSLGNPGLSNAQAGSGNEKPLNYAQLDLSASGSGSTLGGISGGGSGGSCNSSSGGTSSDVKSRNSSDGDEKQPPLSYAKIDFVKSQNMNKAMGGGSGGSGGGGDVSASKM